jgi:hypothetical protein
MLLVFAALNGGGICAMVIASAERDGSCGEECFERLPEADLNGAGMGHGAGGTR